jgi:hypothetical protein
MTRRIGERGHACRRFSGARREFRLTDLPGAFLWVRSTMGITLNVSTISAWADQSGNGNHLTNGVAAQQPLYVPGGLAGRPIVRGDGGDFLTGTGALAVANQPHSIVLVARFTAITGGAVRGLAHYGAASTIGHTSGGLWWWGGASDPGSSGGTADTDWHVLIKSFNGTTQTCYVDGAVVQNAVAATYAPNTLTGILQYSNISPQSMAEEVELGMWNRDLSAEEAAVATAGLLAYWNL